MARFGPNTAVIEDYLARLHLLSAADWAEIARSGPEIVSSLSLPLPPLDLPDVQSMAAEARREGFPGDSTSFARQMVAFNAQYQSAVEAVVSSADRNQAGMAVAQWIRQNEAKRWSITQTPRDLGAFDPIGSAIAGAHALVMSDRLAPPQFASLYMPFLRMIPPDSLRRVRRSRLAITAAIVGVLSLLFLSTTVLGILAGGIATGLGFRARRDISVGRRRGVWPALVGMVTGGLSMAVALVFLGALLASPGR